MRHIIKKSSAESLQSSIASRPTISRTFTNTSNVETSSNNGDSTRKRFVMHRNASKSRKEPPSDDLTKMMTRASNYMTLAYVKIPSVVLCLSYKGKGERNIEDVHDFVFRLPMIEYRNKTWSNLDLALALKKDVIRALISHTGAIIGNKFSKHRPNTAQQSRLRELATSSTVLAPSGNDKTYDNSDASSTYGTSPTDARTSERSKSPRRSFASGNALVRTVSESSSVYSIQSSGRAQSFPASLMMTPSRESQVDNGDDNRSQEYEGKPGGFMANTIGRLKKNRDSTHTNGSGGHGDDDETSKWKRKPSLLGKKILGTLNDY